MQYKILPQLSPVSCKLAKSLQKQVKRTWVQCNNEQCNNDNENNDSAIMRMKTMQQFNNAPMQQSKQCNTVQQTILPSAICNTTELELFVPNAIECQKAQKRVYNCFPRIFLKWKCEVVGFQIHHEHQKLPIHADIRFSALSQFPKHVGMRKGLKVTLSRNERRSQSHASSEMPLAWNRP